MQINRTLLNEKEAARRPVWVFVVIWGVVVMCHSHLGAPLSFKRVLSAVWRCPRSRSPGLLVISMKFQVPVLVSLKFGGYTHARLCLCLCAPSPSSCLARCLRRDRVLFSCRVRLAAFLMQGAAPRDKKNRRKNARELAGGLARDRA